jgi:2'-5' RNA ligase
LRLFAALLLPGATVGLLERWSRDWLEGRAGVRLVPRGNLHVTLKFYGEYPLGKARLEMERAWSLRDGEPLRFDISETGSFGGRVFWVGGGFSRGVAMLAADLGERNLKPHVTVARLSRGGLPPPPPPRLPSGLSGIFSGMALMESTLTPRGAVYRQAALWT